MKTLSEIIREEFPELTIKLVKVEECKKVAEKKSLQSDHTFELTQGDDWRGR